MRRTYEATRLFTLSTFSPPLNLDRGQPIVFDHMEHMGAEQREEVATALGTGALAPISRDADPLPATIEPMPEMLSPMTPNWPLLKERKT